MEVAYRRFFPSIDETEGILGQNAPQAGLGEALLVLR